jgi:putative aminopeptidase FrvX
VYEHFLAEGLREVSIDSKGNVYRNIPGTGLAPQLVVSTHPDTVFPVSIDLHGMKAIIGHFGE